MLSSFWILPALGVALFTLAAGLSWKESRRLEAFCWLILGVAITTELLLGHFGGPVWLQNALVVSAFILGFPLMWIALRRKRRTG
jgi:hypothetical protein